MLPQASISVTPGDYIHGTYLNLGDGDVTPLMSDNSRPSTLNRAEGLSLADNPVTFNSLRNFLRAGRGVEKTRKGQLSPPE